MRSMDDSQASWESVEGVCPWWLAWMEAKSLDGGKTGMDERKCEGYTTPYNNSPFPGALLVMMSTTTNGDVMSHNTTNNY